MHNGYMYATIRFHLFCILAEYAGPLIFYMLLYPRPSIVYGAAAASKPYDPELSYVLTQCFVSCVHVRFYFSLPLIFSLLAAMIFHCLTAALNFHCVFDAIFSFLFILCLDSKELQIQCLLYLTGFYLCPYVFFYRGYGLLVGYFVNHPLYTPPSIHNAHVYTGLALFLFNEYGNFVIHCALRDLRPPGTCVKRAKNNKKMVNKTNRCKVQKKGRYPTSNPLTQLFRFVSCPNYTYEAGSWIAFSVMTQTLTAVLFTLFGFYQMTVWAIGKHRNYRKEFKDYPKGRKAIVPFLL
ncbi:unnamed protein product [Porites lobata]|uniref:3-oxo-5-alpha-steroid 4-dehydrogenase C-terminal domain-containing protein n=1 Tax=Porites lobata TaxID=104759 RepID=A0ABN8RAF5_9CNID|nr:unnamed protein product [Porites lobata]